MIDYMGGLIPNKIAMVYHLDWDESVRKRLAGYATLSSLSSIFKLFREISLPRYADSSLFFLASSRLEMAAW